MGLAAAGEGPPDVAAAFGLLGTADGSLAAAFGLFGTAGGSLAFLSASSLAFFSASRRARICSILLRGLAAAADGGGGGAAAAAAAAVGCSTGTSPAAGTPLRGVAPRSRMRRSSLSSEPTFDRTTFALTRWLGTEELAGLAGGATAEGAAAAGGIVALLECAAAEAASTAAAAAIGGTTAAADFAAAAGVVADSSIERSSSRSQFAHALPTARGALTAHDRGK